MTRFFQKIKKNSGGFTLIELLVVIAIIGILASIVMVSLSGASDKAKDARIKGDLSQIRTIAELIKDDHDSYEYICSNTGTIAGSANYNTQQGIINTDISSQGGEVEECWDASTTYCVSAKLNSTIATADYYCIDSSGIANATASGCTISTTGCNGQTL